jgi:hypothetical protein
LTAAKYNIESYAIQSARGGFSNAFPFTCETLLPRAAHF